MKSSGVLYTDTPPCERYYEISRPVGTGWVWALIARRKAKAQEDIRLRMHISPAHQEPVSKHQLARMELAAAAVGSEACLVSSCCWDQLFCRRRSLERQCFRADPSTNMQPPTVAEYYNTCDNHTHPACEIYGGKQ